MRGLSATWFIILHIGIGEVLKGCLIHNGILFLLKTLRNVNFIPYFCCILTQGFLDNFCAFQRLHFTVLGIKRQTPLMVGHFKGIESLSQTQIFKPLYF